ncbi:hypothetical protein [Riemerella anatipestifer]|nr:hypothetical protein [Riemerella anatipestifer]MBT0551699.1 hypothetical protein [Riemerella anatipestifer]MBT0553165.1 hypothetical protein [Riemerella anatipestifer]MCE3023860.1 hypothetical protein [Riemerella anatipestifer]MCU7541702.1 hypothetical protein [Riemerella anatipestifer]MCU7559487.1 hypothetical protein [Riemerella anatipestifer]
MNKKGFLALESGKFQKNKVMRNLMKLSMLIGVVLFMKSCEQREDFYDDTNVFSVKPTTVRVNRLLNEEINDSIVKSGRDRGIDKKKQVKWSVGEGSNVGKVSVNYGIIMN